MAAQKKLKKREIRGHHKGFWKSVKKGSAIKVWRQAIARRQVPRQVPDTFDDRRPCFY